jgi:PAS domain S-box-containing protein
MTDGRPGGNETAEEAWLARTLLAKVPAMVTYWGADERCRFANAACERLFGVAPDAAIGRTAREVLGPLYELNEPHIKAALRGEEQLFEREIANRTTGATFYGQIHYVPDVVDGTVRGFCTLIADTTRHVRAEEALRNAERELQSSERGRALATLAGGLAHEINNPLTVVLAHLDLALKAVGDWSIDAPTLLTAMGEIRKSAGRVRDIVQSMSLLAGARPTKRRPVDVDDTLIKSLDLASNVIRYRARIVRNLGNVGSVEASASELAQVFVHLLVNAAEALPAQKAETNEIRLETRREGDLVLVEIGDNGTGVPEAIQSMIFEPFFTTKNAGRGAGLGLAVARGIVSSFGGTLDLKSTGAAGSVFRVALQGRASESTPPPGIVHRSAPPPAAVVRPRLLVVDDEMPITRLLAHVLDKKCEVTAVNQGERPSSSCAPTGHTST